MQESFRKKKNESLSLKKAWGFWEHVKSEFLKIQWTEGEEVRVYAQIVVVATFLLGMGIYAADVCIRQMLDLFEGVFRALFG